MMPVLITYIRTQDKGQELRYALRSLNNITNFNGDVWVVGDREKWFGDIVYIRDYRLESRPYLDQARKIYSALQYMPEKFIISMDDVYVTEPVEIGVYTLGELKDDVSSFHKRTKKMTKDKLLELGLPIKDYETHAPMLVERYKLKETLEFILESKKSLQWRSMYGNMHRIEAEPFEDKKTRDSHLKTGPILSTIFYTSELHDLFPEPSLYEVKE